MRWKQRIVATYDDRTTSCGMKTLQIVVSNGDNPDDLKYLLGIISSSLVNYYCINYLADDMNRSYLSRLPIRPIDPSSPDDVEKHDRMVSLVETMLDLHRRLPAAATEHQRRLLEMQVEATDRAIDDLVFDLYGLTPDERAVVEAGVARKG